MAILSYWLGSLHWEPYYAKRLLISTSSRKPKPLYVYFKKSWKKIGGTAKQNMIFSNNDTKHGLQRGVSGLLGKYILLWVSGGELEFSGRRCFGDQKETYHGGHRTVSRPFHLYDIPRVG
jgi:hypothetical protein